MDFCLISNSCVAREIYQLEGLPDMEWRSPLMGSIFLDDSQYIRFCEKYDRYINCTPTFGIPIKRYTHPAIKQDYPVMYLSGIEIHWIHEDTEESALRKFEGRRELSKDLPRIFLWSSSEFLNIHGMDDRRRIMKRFTNLDEMKIFLTERPNEVQESVFLVPEYQGKEQTDRTDWGAMMWNDRKLTAQTFKNIIECINTRTE